MAGSAGVCPVFGSSIFGSCAGENRRPILPAILQFDFCNISQFWQFLGVVGLSAGSGPHVAVWAVLSRPDGALRCPASWALCVPPRCAGSGGIAGSAGGVPADAPLLFFVNCNKSQFVDQKVGPPACFWSSPVYTFRCKKKPRPRAWVRGLYGGLLGGHLCLKVYPAAPGFSSGETPGRHDWLGVFSCLTLGLMLWRAHMRFRLLVLTGLCLICRRIGRTSWRR